MINLELMVCSGCGACAQICPKNAIKLCENDIGFLYPIIDKQKCINCNLCDNICLNSKNSKIENFDHIRAYAAKNKDRATKLRSSSGGCFSLFAEYILEHDGIVFGAAFDGNFTVRHIAIKSKDELKKLRGSKYVQSRLENTFCEVKQYLQEGKLVYFSGTPCQVEGLLKYIGSKNKNLITQDIICHGVPSDMLWKNYLRYQSKKFRGEPIDVSFREKVVNNSDYYVKIEFSNGRVYQTKAANDLYMKAYLSNACLRESCYNCRYKTLYRNSDITLADYWGVEKYHPAMQDGEGVSLLFINSELGWEVFNAVKEKMDYEKTSCEQAIKNNPSAIYSVPHFANKERFFNDLKKRDVKYAVIHNCCGTRWQRIKNRIKKTLKIFKF